MTLLLLALFALCAAAIVLYNRLIGRRNQVDYAFGGVDALLKKRWDLVPNLVESVQEYTKHESRVLDELTRLRSRALSEPSDPDAAVALDSEASRVLRGLLVSVEAYPELAASESFQHLQRALAEIEEQISAARRAYNAAVTRLNDAVEMFPSNLVANWMGLRRRRVFAIEPSEAERPEVGMLFERARG